MEKKDANRTRFVGVRFTPEEYKKMGERWKATRCRKLSDFIRRQVFNKPVTTVYRNQSLDDFMYEIIRLRGELNAVGNNFNQKVKKLHTLKEIPEFRYWNLSAQHEQKLLMDKVEELAKHFRKFSEKWLQ
ncbi:plasmid mobilization protein [Flavobacterium agrisoli]|nr:plasmid mobilization relaxosome protein MobC [Flavobacterium agrisoli]